MALLKNKIFLASFIAVILLITMVVVTPPVSATHYSLSISPESGEVTPPGSVSATVTVNFQTLSSDPKANTIIFFIPSYDLPEWLDFKVGSPATPGSPGTFTITVSADAPQGKHTIKFRTCNKDRMVGPVCQHAPMYWGSYELTITKKVLINGFVGVDADIPLSEAKVILHVRRDENTEENFETHADRFGRYSFEFSLREEPVEALIQVILTDDEWIGVYDELGFGGSKDFVWYATEKFTIDGSQSEVVKDVLITDELRSSVHDRRLNKDVATVYHFAWKAARFAEDVLKVQPRPVKIYVFEDRTRYTPDRIHLSRISVKNTSFSKEVYPYALWHEFSHHIEAISPFFGAPEDFNGEGYINHGGYYNPDSKDSVNEGFAIFMSAVIANHYGFTEPNILNPPDPDPINLDLNMDVSWTTWDGRGFEDYTVAGILWDLYDPVDPRDHDEIQLPLATIWSVLNTLKKPATLYDIFKAFSSHPGMNKKALEDRFAKSEVFVDSNDNGILDDTERDSIGRSNWGYWDFNKNGKLDPDGEIFPGGYPYTTPGIGYPWANLPKHWDYEREIPSAVEHFSIILESKKPIESPVAKVQIKHFPPYDFYDWGYEFQMDVTSMKIPMPVFIRDDAVVTVTFGAEGYPETAVYEIDGESWLEKVMTPGLEYLEKVSIEPGPLVEKPSPRVPIFIVVAIVLVILAMLIWLIWKFKRPQRSLRA